MKLEKNWQDITIYNVSFGTHKHESLDRLVIVKNSPREADVEALIHKHLPNVVILHHIDEWGTGLSLKETVDTSTEFKMIGMEVVS